MIHNQLCTDPTLIAEEITSFYSKLYSSAFSINVTGSFFNHTKDHIPHIDEEFAELCEADIIYELDNAIDSLSLNKSPGCDGLTSNFYLHFWNLLKNLLFFLMLKEATDSLSFPPTMKQGIITSIPKLDKDSKILDNR